MKLPPFNIHGLCINENLSGFIHQKTSAADSFMDLSLRILHQLRGMLGNVSELIRKIRWVLAQCQDVVFRVWAEGVKICSQSEEVHRASISVRHDHKCVGKCGKSGITLQLQFRRWCRHFDWQSYLPIQWSRLAAKIRISKQPTGKGGEGEEWRAFGKITCFHSETGSLYTRNELERVVYYNRLGSLVSSELLC